MNPLPGADEIAAFYDVPDYYTHRSAAAGASGPQPSVADRLRVHLAWRMDRGQGTSADWFAECVRYSPGRVCELGCGGGRLLASLAARGHSVVGVDPDETARRVAFERGVRVLPGTAESLPAGLERGSFDAVLMVHSLEHCLDPLRAARNAASLLSPTGSLVIETPNSDCLGLRWAGTSWASLDVPRHLHFFTAGSLRIVSGAVGLSVGTEEYAGFLRQFQGEWIGLEQEIWRRMAAADGPRSRPGPRPPDGWRRWALLLRMVLARPSQRYDSVRVVAQRQDSAVQCE